MPSVNALHVTRVVHNPIPANAPASEYLLPSRASPVIHRGYSSSPLEDFSTMWRSSSREAPTPLDGESTNWWTNRQIIPRPWEGRRQRTIPTEQAERWAQARECVAEAAVNVLGTTGDIMHELLKANVNFLRFPPSIALKEAARTLLNIWDALQLVDIDRRAGLRLTERCAAILMSVREDVAEMGDEFGAELQAPVTRLIESFSEVHRFLVKQSRRPFINRYLQRDEIQHALVGCHGSLSDALSMFNLSIQIRILKQVLCAEEQHYHVSPTSGSALTNMLQITGTESAPTESTKDVLATLQAMSARQNERDMANDADDLRELMRAALETNNDAEMIHVLQVGRDELPEAIKTLQRALEVESDLRRSATEEQKAVIVTAAPAEDTVTSTGEASNPERSAIVVSTDPSQTSSDSNYSGAGTSLPFHDTLNCEFMETGIDPIPLPPLPPNTTASFIEDSITSADTSYCEAAGELSVSTTQRSFADDASHSLLVDQRQENSSSSSSLHGSRSERAAPAPLPSYDSEAAETLRNEQRYRLLLQHEFHPSLTLPLWTPSPVAIGAVGYHSKARGGEFITLFSSLDPAESSGGRAKDIPNVSGYGRESRQGYQRRDKRNVAQRGMDIVHFWLTPTWSKGEAKYSRRYSVPLRVGHKTAHLFTESTRYRYIEDLSTPKKWFKANVDQILAVYGDEHHISKEDLHLVIGTLKAKEYALFVSHEHANGQVDFNVSSAAHVTGQPWGEFSFSFDVSSSSLHGPSYDEPIGNPQWARRISSYGNNDKWDSLLLARLRFKPDQDEPTSL